MLDFGFLDAFLPGLGALVLALLAFFLGLLGE